MAEGSVSILLLSWLAIYTPGIPSIRPKSVMYLLLKFIVMLRLYKVLLYPAWQTHVWVCQNVAGKPNSQQC